MEKDILEEEFEESQRLLFGEYCDVKNMMNRADACAMMHYYLDALQLDIGKLKYVHVTGSKGKGTTCTYIEKALRLHGLKTGLFTSPHIQSICERFRINGNMISKETYLRHFHRVWNKLQEIKHKAPGDRPSYITNWPGFFRFLTIMAFELFLEEKVDVVILEVGMGGRLDSTNVIDEALATGISLIDLEHTEVLGSTLEAIATEKGGIFKKNAPAFVLTQKEEVMHTLENCAKSAECCIQFTSRSDFSDSLKGCFPPTFPSYLLDNFSVAYAITKCVLQQYSIQLDDKIMEKVLISTQVPARAQIIQKESHTFYIDGAHTPVSVQRVCEWFSQCTSSEKCLLFYCGRDKHSEDLIRQLIQIPFSRVILAMVKNPKPEYTKITLPSIEEVMNNNHISDCQLFTGIEVTPEAENEKWLMYLAQLWRIEESICKKEKIPITIVKDTDDALHCVNTHSTHDVCCTGSLYLCGDLLNSLEWVE